MTGKTSQSSFRQDDSKQMEFEWVPSPSIDGTIVASDASLHEPHDVKSTASSQLGDSGISSPTFAKRPRVLLAQLVERLLRERNLPYVAVDEAKRALFVTAKLASFHHVVYQKEGANWLVWAANVRPGVKEDLKQWEQVFGDGFLAVIARRKSNGEIGFRKLDGSDVELK